MAARLRFMNIQQIGPQKKKLSKKEHAAQMETRTPDLLITSQALYQLSYSSCCSWKRREDIV